jgi:hypothetical protein
MGSTVPLIGAVPVPPSQEMAGVPGSYVAAVIAMLPELVQSSLLMVTPAPHASVCSWTLASQIPCGVPQSQVPHSRWSSDPL